MKFKIKFFILCFFIISSTSLSAQLEVARLYSKDFSGVGGAAFLNFSTPISEADYITTEFGIYFFSNNGDNVVLVPLLAGYRYTFDRTGTGLYAEPSLGYTWAGTDIPKLDVNGNQIYDNGNQVFIKASGVNSGINLGYLFQPSEGRIRFQLNIALRYQHTFSEMGQNMLSLRLSSAFSFGSRN